MAKTDKVIVTVKSALQSKYKTNFGKVQTALSNLVKADKAKGLNTLLVYLDNKTQMRSLKASAVTSQTNRSQFKAAIDSVYNFTQPDYILIFGAIDIVPHQLLVNPLYDPSPDGDEDHHVPSDLPYACDVAYNNNISKFISPVRVVGRLADINGVADIDFVNTVINNAINMKPKDKAEYLNYFSVSAEVWEKSTELSVKCVFGNPKSLLLAPPNGPKYTANQLKPLSHFINCHGSNTDDSYYGQRGENYPKALTSSALNAKISADSIVAVECCYGAQLYNAKGRSLPIVNSYFKNGAIAMLGSTTIAYGPADENDQADLLCQYFFFNIHGGCSTGRALLEARHKYILNHGPDLSPTDLKTLAQFNLIGDPSLHPVKDTTADNKKSLGIKSNTKLDDNGRIERRKFLISKGVSLQSFANSLKAGVNFTSTQKSVAKILRMKKMDKAKGKTYKIQPNKTNAKSFKNSVFSDALYHLFIKQEGDNKKQRVLSIKEINGKVVSVKEYVRR